MRSLPIAGALLLCGAILLGGYGSVAAQGPVADWGDPERIVISGSKHWPADEIRRELISNLDAIIAAHPAAPLVDYPQALADRVRDGYFKGGFPLANVSVRLDPQSQRVNIAIEEGPRYMAGAIQVHGPPGCDAAHVAAWLTAKQPARGARLTGFIQQGNEQSPRWVDKNGKRIEAEEPMWTPGQPARFPTGAAREYVKAAGRALEQQGFPSATIETAVVPDHAQRTAALVVVVQALGRRNTIDRIEVTGGKRDTPADVIRYLGVRPGQVVTESHCGSWKHALWLSGRYLEQDVSVETPPADGGEVAVKIHLVEYAAARPLREPLSQEEQLVLKCREWATAAIERGDALVVRGASESTRLEFVTVQDQGTLCLLEPIPPAPGGIKWKQTKPLLPGPTLFAGMPGELLHIYGGGTQLLSAPFSKGQFIVNIDIQPNPDLKDAKHQFALKMGIGFRSATDMHALEPVAVSLSLAPVALLGLINDPKNKHSIESGVFTIKSGGGTCRIDVATGRLLDFVVQKKKDGPQLTVSIESQPFAEYLAAAEHRMGAGLPQASNAYDNQRPISSVFEFLLGSPLAELGMEIFDHQKHVSGDLLAGARALNQLVAGEAFWPLDACARQTPAARDDDFWIPTGGNSFFEPDPAFPLSNSTSMAVALITLRHADEIFPRQSWPWIVSRDSALFLMKQPQLVDADVKNLRESKEMGPIGHLITARLLAQINPSSAARFAERGIELRRLEDFRADYRPFLDQEKWAGQILARSAELMRDFTDDEADELGHMLLGKDHYLLVVATRYLRAHKSEPIEQTLPGMLDHLWEHGLSKAVRSRLIRASVRNDRLAKAVQKKTL